MFRIVEDESTRCGPLVLMMLVEDEPVSRNNPMRYTLSGDGGGSGLCGYADDAGGTGGGWLDDYC